ncbi:hypothetical protein, partial [Gelidibacter sp.]|uniref:hypothetical protein n=1 Tax=Gelidibacter sp. TaxID=2018083 RepID=UPI0032634236
LFKKIREGIKAKDTPWDAVQMGSVVCTVGANIPILSRLLYISIIFIIITETVNIVQLSTL